MTGLVLSLFPGIGLLDQAFEEEGFCVVRGPDLLWGGDVRRFHPPPERFEGVIGGPPCQSWSGLGKVNKVRWGEDCVLPDMIPDFERCIRDAKPLWFVMENVVGAPLPCVEGYSVKSIVLNNLDVGGEQDRTRRISFGIKGRYAHPAPFIIDVKPLRPQPSYATVISTGQNGKGGPRASIETMARAQGLDPARFEHSPFSRTELRRAIANGVPLPMGKAVARAVNKALSYRQEAA